MKPIIGIVGRPSENENKKTTIIVLDNYRKAVIQAGGIPLLILPPQNVDYDHNNPKDVEALTDLEKEIIKRQIDLVDGIIMPGGTKTYEYDKYICELAQNKPLLGICMGMQVMCNYDNNNQNILNETPIHQQPDEDYVHEVIIDDTSYLYDIIKEKQFKVNSRHNYHVSNSGSYNVCGHSDDGLIEAIYKDAPFNIGVQWHPEKNYDTDVISQRLFEKFIEEAKKAKERL